jgi:hypothetical protein
MGQLFLRPSKSAQNQPQGVLKPSLVAVKSHQNLKVLRIQRLVLVRAVYTEIYDQGFTPDSSGFNKTFWE